MQTAKAIPDKLFFKIGEVCELVEVQAHVLRYWESEFPMLQPQKNRAGQRTYRRKDVEMALRIKELLYDEGFTIAGAKRKLANEGRAAAAKFKVVPPSATSSEMPLAQNGSVEVEPPGSLPSPSRPYSRDTLKRLRLIAEDLLITLNRDVIENG
jgi:DNA-binding transcriptional MerR regulator